MFVEAIGIIICSTTHVQLAEQNFPRANLIAKMVCSVFVANKSGYKLFQCRLFVRVEFDGGVTIPTSIFVSRHQQDKAKALSKALSQHSFLFFLVLH